MRNAVPGDRYLLLPCHDWHRRQPDTGTHSASGWALRQWRLPLPELTPGEPERSEEQEQRIASLAAKVADLDERIVLNRHAWER